MDAVIAYDGKAGKMCVRVSDVITATLDKEGLYILLTRESASLSFPSDPRAWDQELYDEIEAFYHELLDAMRLYAGGK